MLGAVARTHLPISTWPAAERPRERLLDLGVGALADAELVALLLGNGASGASALDLARALLAEHGGLAGLGRVSAEILARGTGMGPAKAARLLAACELGRRRERIGGVPGADVDCAERAAALASALLRDKRRECLLALFLDQRHRLLKAEILSEGGWRGAEVDPRPLFARALELSASALIVAHNHPSGHPQASAEDTALTRRLSEGAALLGLRLLDHLIIGDGCHVSMAAETRILTRGGISPSASRPHDRPAQSAAGGLRRPEQEGPGSARA